MNRRTLFNAGVVLSSGLVTDTLAACSTTPGSTEQAGSTSSGPASADTAPADTSSANATASDVASSAGVSPGAAGSRVLLAYFSRPGENYYYGDRIDLEVGNTQVVAEIIAAATNVTVFRIQAADPYPQDYDETVTRNVQEENDDARPAIAAALPDLAGYDTVLLGCPVWNSQTPMIMRTFVEGVDLAGKTIHPFVTYAVSRMGRVEQDYAALCPDSTLGESLAVQGEEAAQAGPDVTAWLRRIGL